jgi:hypothetical protein
MSKKLSIQCFLCGKIGESSAMTKFSNWKDDWKTFILKHLPESPPNDVSICKKDQLEAKRHIMAIHHIYLNGSHN